MRKHAIWGAVALLLSCGLIVCGWWVTKELLAQNERVLLSESGIAALTRKAPTPPTIAPETIPLSNPPATLAEIVHILRIWEDQNNVVPHEPSMEQLTMEQAVTVGRVWLEKLLGEGLLSAADSKVDAFLCSNRPPYPTLIATVPAALGTIRPQDELTPYFSYWTVHFQEENLNATLIIHAATGQVWKAELSLEGKAVAVDQKEALALLVEPLSLEGEEVLIRDGQTASQSFGEGELFAILETTFAENAQSIKLFLTTK